MRKDAVSKKTTAKIEKLADGVLKAVAAGKNPFLDIPVRSLANVSWSEKRRLVELGNQKQKRYFFNVSMAKKFMQTFLVSEACKELIESGKTTSIRDLYYVTKHTIGDTKQNTFEEQDESDPIIEDLEVTVDALREELHLFAARKGSMVGPITITDTGDTIDLRRMGSGGWAVPSIVEENVITFRKHEAKYVLLIEKDAVWTRFNEDKFWKRNSCIIVQGGGQPPRGVRRLVQRLHRELKLPVYVLVDNDPWGFYIYSVMKQGSINLAYESMRMAVPDARFVGLSSFDKDEVPAARTTSRSRWTTATTTAPSRCSPTPGSSRRTGSARSRRWCRSGLKFELEALSRRGISFITEEYVPEEAQGPGLAGVSPDPALADMSYEVQRRGARRPAGGLAHRRSAASQQCPVPVPGHWRRRRRTLGLNPDEPGGRPSPRCSRWHGPSAVTSDSSRRRANPLACRRWLRTAKWMSRMLPRRHGSSTRWTRSLPNIGAASSRESTDSLVSGRCGRGRGTNSGRHTFCN